MSAIIASAVVLLAHLLKQETGSYLLLPQAGGVPRLFYTSQTGSNYTVFDESLDEYHHFSLNHRDALKEIGLYNLTVNNTVTLTPIQSVSVQQGFHLKDEETGLEVQLAQQKNDWQIHGPDPGEISRVEVAAFSLADV